MFLGQERLFDKGIWVQDRGGSKALCKVPQALQLLALGFEGCCVVRVILVLGNLTNISTGSFVTCDLEGGPVVAASPKTIELHLRNMEFADFSPKICTASFKVCNLRMEIMLNRIMASIPIAKRTQSYGKGEACTGNSKGSKLLFKGPWETGQRHLHDGRYCGGFIASIRWSVRRGRGKIVRCYNEPACIELRLVVSQSGG